MIPHAFRLVVSTLYFLISDSDSIQSLVRNNLSEECRAMGSEIADLISNISDDDLVPGG